MKQIKTLTGLLILIVVAFAHGQDPIRFADEVSEIVARNEKVNRENLILFTGSSSIRFWKSLGADFPKRNVLNNGFGGSEMSDLLYYAKQLILQYQPMQVFIYEGDNDIAAGRELDQIMANAIQLATLIKKELPNCAIVFISPKPSVARQELTERYHQLNAMLKKWCVENEITFVDVWPAMMDRHGKLRTDIFIEDNLHMNAKGYAIWTKLMKPYLKD